MTTCETCLSLARALLPCFASNISRTDVSAALTTWLAEHTPRESEAEPRVERVPIANPMCGMCGGLGYLSDLVHRVPSDSRAGRLPCPSCQPPHKSEASGQEDQGDDPTCQHGRPLHQDCYICQGSGELGEATPPLAGATAGPYRVDYINDYYKISGPGCDEEHTSRTPWFLINRAKELANAAYRAGRDSMREPTEAMIKAGTDAARSNYTKLNNYKEDARAVWDAMWKARDD